MRKELLLVSLLCVIGVTACGSTTTYNITFETGAFRVSDEIRVPLSQGGDKSREGGASGQASGGEESSPGGSNVLDGFAQQGNIFQIGTAAKPTTTATTDAAVDIKPPVAPAPIQ